MWVKICANTSIEDAQDAVNQGADAVGFVFAPSVRRVTPEQVRTITEQLAGRVELIGVFPEMPFEEIRDAVRVAKLTGVQLHGGDGQALARKLRSHHGDGLTIIQVMHWGDGNLEETLRVVREEGIVDRVLVDSRVGSLLGGTGRAFDWKAAKELYLRAEGMPMIVAGGLNTENVAEAVQRLKPWGVDVASGVEATLGRKNSVKIGEFLKRAKNTKITES